MALWASLAANAAPVTVSFCFDINTDYTDIGGDFWTTNEPRAARGVRYDVKSGSPAVTSSGTLDGSGCATATIDNAHSWAVRVRSEAVWNGVEVLSRAGSCHPTNAPEVTGWFVAAGSTTVMEEVVGPSDRWGNLAIATWAMHRNTHGMGTGTNRACCQEGNPYYQDDGTCSNGVSDYIPITGPMVLYSNPTTGQFADWIPDCANPATHPGHRALNITEDTSERSLISHEIGHLVTSMRMGWSDEGWSLAAPLEACMGDHGSPSTSPLDWNAEQRRGEFTKEYIDAAIREGYADFFAMWLWNSRTGSDCVLDMWTLHDFDLDCDVDNYFGTSDERNGQVNCASGWEVEEADSGDPTSAYSDGENWLKDLWAASDSRSFHPSTYVCNPSSGGITAGCTGSSTTEHERATVIDVAKFFWKLNQSSAGDVPPKTVTDLYIDACPRGWDNDEPDISHDAHPVQRLIFAADENGITTEFEDYEDYFRP